MWFTKKVIVRDEKREKELSNDLAESQRNNIDLVDKVTELQKHIQGSAEATKKIKQERDELKKMVRNQTEADLLVNSLKSLGIIPPEKEAKKENYFDCNIQLQAMRGRAASFNTQLPFRDNHGLSNLFGPLSSV